MSSYHPALVVIGLSPGAVTTFSKEKFGLSVRLHGMNYGRLAGQYVLVFLDIRARESYLRETDYLAKLRKKHRERFGFEFRVVKRSYNVVEDGILEQDENGWHIAEVPYAFLEQRMVDLHNGVLLKISQGTRDQTTLALGSLVSFENTLHSRACYGQPYCLVHVPYADLVSKAVTEVLRYGYADQALAMVGNGTKFLSNCAYASSRPASAWFNWLRYTMVCPKREFEQESGIDDYSSDLMTYGKKAKSEEDIVNALHLHYNLGKWYSRHLSPGFGGRGIKHLNEIIKMGDKCFQYPSLRKLYSSLVILAKMVMGFEPRTRPYRVMVFGEIMAQVPRRNPQDVSKVSISLKGIQVLPCALNGNESPSILQYYCDGLTLTSVKVVGAENRGPSVPAVLGNIDTSDSNVNDIAWKLSNDLGIRDEPFLTEKSYGQDVPEAWRGDLSGIRARSEPLSQVRFEQPYEESSESEREMSKRKRSQRKQKLKRLQAARKENGSRV